MMAISVVVFQANEAARATASALRDQTIRLAREVWRFSWRAGAAA